MITLQNYIKAKSKQIRMFDSGGTIDYPYIERHQGGGFLAKLAAYQPQIVGALKNTAKIGAAGAIGYGAYELYNDYQATGNEDIDVKVGIDDDNGMLMSNGQPILKIEFEQNYDMVGNSYSFDLASFEAAYQLKKALKMPDATQRDNTLFSVSPELALQAFTSLTNVHFADPQDAIILQVEVLPRLNQMIALGSARNPTNMTLPAQYVVTRGDTLQVISDKFKVPTAAIIGANQSLQGRNASIMPGMTLTIPSVGGTNKNPNIQNPGGGTGGGQTKVGGAMSGLRDKYMTANKKRLANKALRNETQGRERRQKAQAATNPNRKRRLENKATRSEARALKADYKAKNLQ